MLTAARCRTVQAFGRLGRRLHPIGKQTVEAGAGALFSVGQLLRDRRLKKPLVAAYANETAASYKLLHALSNEDITCTVYDKLPGEPTAADADAVAAAYKAGGYDCFIALGDRALLDIAKAAAASCGSHGRPVRDLVGHKIRSRRTPPVIAAPTAAGSGRSRRSSCVHLT